MKRCSKCLIGNNGISGKSRTVFGGVSMGIRYLEGIDILNIELQSGDFEYSEEVAEGVIVDISKEGEILSIEIIDAKRRLGESVANQNKNGRR